LGTLRILTITPLSRAQGFGRGGRLGHPEEKYHSGQEAVIHPRAVEALQGHTVRTVAAAKHHTLAVTADGSLFAWGRNRDGQLGTGNGGAGANGHPTPRLVTALKPFACVAAAAAHCHSVAVTSAGALYAWGGNRYVAAQRALWSAQIISDRLTQNMWFDSSVSQPRAAGLLHPGRRCVRHTAQARELAGAPRGDGGGGQAAHGGGDGGRQRVHVGLRPGDAAQSVAGDRGGCDGGRDGHPSGAQHAPHGASACHTSGLRLYLHHGHHSLRSGTPPQCEELRALRPSTRSSMLSGSPAGTVGADVVLDLWPSAGAMHASCRASGSTCGCGFSGQDPHRGGHRRG
jgi:hypothetical protein